MRYVFASIASSLLCLTGYADDTTQHEIVIQGTILCPNSQEFESFSQTIYAHDDTGCSYEEWKQEFIMQNTSLIKLIESGNIRYSSWEISVDEPLRPILEGMLQAIASNDYSAFIQQGSAELKEALTPEIFSDIQQQLNLSDYQLFYLGSIQRSEGVETVWKLVLDETERLICFSTKEECVTGIWIR